MVGIMANWQNKHFRFSVVGIMAAGLVSYLVMHQAAPSRASSNQMTNPFADKTLYVDPDSNAATQEKQWRATRPADAAQMAKIATQAQAMWFGWTTNIYQDVKAYMARVAKANAYPVVVAYNIPLRDCGMYSAGGARSDAAYKQWIVQFSNGIGNQPAALILEPDALAGMDCLSTSQQAGRINDLKYAVNTLSSHTNLTVYVDIGNSTWLPPAEAAKRLKEVDIAKVSGFSLNVSYSTTAAQNTVYGEAVSKLLDGKHFVINTSRSGRGQASLGDWCNPPGRGLGQRPTSDTGNALVDAYLWIKPPGESDGYCNGGPKSGQWWPTYALGLARNSFRSSCG